MPGLSSSDIKAFNAAVLELHSTASTREFPSKIHKAVRKMMSGDIVVVDWVNPRTSLSLGCRYFPDDIITDELNAFVHVMLPTQAPMWLQCVDAPHACSDYMSRRDWAKREICVAFREIAQEEFIGFEARFSPSLTMMVADLRGSFGSYTEAERMKLNLLGPHLHQVYRRLVARGNVTSDCEQVLRQTQAIVRPDGRVRDWTMSARRLLADYDLRVSGDQLPGAVKDWFLAQLRGLSRPDDPTAGLRPLCIGRGHHKLWLYLMRGAAGDRYHLVLQEKKIVADDRQAFRRLGVSEREAEVLLWLTCGKTNPEIGKILGVSPGTVRRHLENIFPKLGVENRHAAALAAMQAQARQDLPG